MFEEGIRKYKREEKREKNERRGNGREEIVKRV